MPILEEETTHFPGDAIERWAGDGRRWLALYTKARQEKSLARELLKYRIPFYLPLVKRRALRGAESGPRRCRYLAAISFVLPRKRSGCGR